jgi:CRP/FNR family transcriptional regulator/CRP/FNR family cyclic AMP-dependent transcriptional regulator
MGERVLEVSAGESILREGEIGHEIYIVGTGRVEVSRTRDDTRVVLAVLGPGAIFGELGLLESLPRTASVTALEDSTIFAIDSAALLARLANDPMFALKLLQRMSARIRRLVDELVQVTIVAAGSDDDVQEKLAEIEYAVPGYL